MKDTATSKEKFIWNMLGSLSGAFSSFILSVAVNRILGSSSGGIFAFAYASSQLFYTIGSFEIRPYQSTDVEERFGFDSYRALTRIMCVFMLMASFIYVYVQSFETEKKIAVFLLVIYKMIEAYTDVWGGRYQQKDRIDIAGKLFFMRVTYSTIGFIILIVITKDLLIGIIGMIIISAILYLFNDLRYRFNMDRHKCKYNFKEIVGIFKETIPLFIGAFIMMYISNAPKYAINSIMDDNTQNIYNILFMPAFVINMFSMFIFRPMLVDMAEKWCKNKKNEIKKIIWKMYGVIGGLTIIVIITGYLLGVPVLSFIYGVDISAYIAQFVFVLIGGGINALMTFSYYTVTVLRKQKWLLIGYIIGFIYALLFANYNVKNYGINGAIFTYGIAISAIVVFFTFIIGFTIKNEGEK